GLAARDRAHQGGQRRLRVLPRPTLARAVALSPLRRRTRRAQLARAQWVEPVAAAPNRRSRSAAANRAASSKVARRCCACRRFLPVASSARSACRVSVFTFFPIWHQCDLRRQAFQTRSAQTDLATTTRRRAAGPEDLRSSAGIGNDERRRGLPPQL